MSRFPCIPPLAALVMAAAATSAAGQSSDPPFVGPQAADDAKAARGLFAARLPVDSASESGFALPSIQLRAEGDSSEAAVVLSGVRQNAWINAWSVRFATPIQDGETSGNFITDRGFTGSSSVRVALSHASGLPGFATPLVERRDLALRAIQICEGRAETEAARAACPALTFAELRRYLSPDEEVRLADAAFENARIWLWTAALEVGHQEIAWRDPLSLAERDTERTAYALSLSGGVHPGGAYKAFYFGGGVELAREYQAGDSRTLCAPPPAAGPQECFTARFGAPEPRDTEVVHLVGRIQHNWPIPFAFELQPAYDVRNDVAEVAATLYFVPDSDGALRGGLRARWRSEDDDPLTDDDQVTFGIFVGAPFGSQ